MTRPVGGVWLAAVPSDHSAAGSAGCHSYPPRAAFLAKEPTAIEHNAYRPHSYPAHTHLAFHAAHSLHAMQMQASTQSTQQPTANTSPDHQQPQPPTSDPSPTSSAGLTQPRMKRSGTGGFYEFDPSQSGSEVSLADLFHGTDASSSIAVAPCSSTEPIDVRMTQFSSRIENESLFMSPNARSSASPDDAFQEHQVAGRPRPHAHVAAAPFQSPLPVVHPKLTAAQQEQLDRTNLLGVLACSLEQICPLTDVLPTDPHYLSLFHTSALPGISIRDYFSRLASYTAVSSECLVQTCIHIHRLARAGRAEVERTRALASQVGGRVASPVSPCSSVTSGSSFHTSAVALPFHPRINSFSQQPFLVSAYNIHRLLLTAMLTSAKYCDDAFYNNRIYSTLGGISLKELNRLECEFLSLVEYKMYVSAGDFLSEYERLNASCNHGHWCLKIGHAAGPIIRVHPEDVQINDDVESDQSSAGSSINELDVSGFQISPPSARTQESERASIQSHATHQQQSYQPQHSRTQSDDCMRDSQPSSTATTPVYSYSNGLGRPSASPSSDYVSEVVSMPPDDSHHAHANHQLSHSNDGWATIETFGSQPRPHSSQPLQHSTHAFTANPAHATMHASLHEYRYAHEPATMKKPHTQNHSHHHHHNSASLAHDGFAMVE